MLFKRFWLLEFSNDGSRNAWLVFCSLAKETYRVLRVKHRQVELFVTWFKFPVLLSGYLSSSFFLLEHQSSSPSVRVLCNSKSSFLCYPCKFLFELFCSEWGINIQILKNLSLLFLFCFIAEFLWLLLPLTYCQRFLDFFCKWRVYDLSIDPLEYLVPIADVLFNFCCLSFFVYCIFK